MQLGLQILVNICQKTFLCKIIFVHVCSVELKENNVALCTYEQRKKTCNRNFKYKNQIQGFIFQMKKMKKHIEITDDCAIVGTRNFTKLCTSNCSIKTVYLESKICIQLYQICWKKTMQLEDHAAQSSVLWGLAVHNCYLCIHIM